MIANKTHMLFNINVFYFVLFVLFLFITIAKRARKLKYRIMKINIPGLKYVKFTYSLFIIQK